MLSIYANVRVVFRYRWLLYELVVRDLRLRYRGSVLGFAWTLLNPVLFMGIYALVFGVFLKANVPNYPLFLLAGLIPWYWVTGAVSQSVTSIVDNATYVGKTLMPTELLVLVPVASNGLNFLITMALLFPVAIALHVNVLWAFLFLPLLIAIELCLVLGVSLLVSTFNVFYRDLQQLVGYVLLAVFFLTPIFYAKSSIPPKIQFIVKYNPIAALMSGYQDTFYAGALPSWHALAFAALFAIFVLGVGVGYFNRFREAFVEYI
jgi:lipopolysaccharide transport system permease protein